MSRLSNDDSCAVDLLLDRDQHGVCYSTSSSQSVIQRLSSVEKILKQLDLLPAPHDPSHDLVARTLTRCDQAAAVRGVTPPPPTGQPIITVR
jgi:hypothetical protein